MHKTLKDALGLGKIPLSELKARAQRHCQVFQGYLGEYRYLPVSGSEVSFSTMHTRWNPDRTPVGGFDGWTAFGHQSGSFWRVVCTQYGGLTKGDPVNPVFLRVFPFINAVRVGVELPLRLMHANVMGLTRSLTEMLLQVSFVAGELKILDSADNRLACTFEKAQDDSNEQTPDSDTLCTLRAPVAAWRLADKTGCEFAKELQLKVCTPYGSLEVFYTAPDAAALYETLERTKSAIVDVKGWLIGDCATGRYQDGPQYDTYHLLEVIASSQEYDMYKAITPVLDPGVRLFAEGELAAEGDLSVVDWFRTHTGHRVQSGMGHDPLFCRCRDEASKRSIPGVALRYENDPDHFLVVQIECNERQLIDTVRVRKTGKNDMDTFFSFDEWKDNTEEYLRKDICVAGEEAMTQLWQDITEENIFDRANSVGEFWLFSEHDHTLAEPVLALTGTPKALDAALSRALSQNLHWAGKGYDSNVLYTTSGDGPGFLLSMPPFNRDRDTAVEVSELTPQLPGIPCSQAAEIRARYIPNGRLRGEIAVKLCARRDPLIFCVPNLDLRSNDPGNSVQLALSGAVLDLEKRKPESISVSEGKLYETLLKDFLERHPDKTKADFPCATLCTDEMHMLLPDKTGAYFTLTANAESVSEADLLGIPLLVIDTYLCKGSDPDVRIRLYANKSLVKEPLKAGDSFTCTFFGMATYVPDPQKECYAT